MKLDFFNNLLNNVKENNVILDFINELSYNLETLSNKISNTTNNGLKQEDGIYQVVDIGTDGAYLQNVNDNKIVYETDISKELLKKIGNDTVLKYQKNMYIIDEELSEEFLNNLVGFKEFKEIQNKFEKYSNILKNDSNTRYKLEKKNENYCILTYETDEIHTLKAPKELIPFWAKSGENLYYENGVFNRTL